MCIRDSNISEPITHKKHDASKEIEQLTSIGKVSSLKKSLGESKAENHVEQINEISDFLNGINDDDDDDKQEDILPNNDDKPEDDKPEDDKQEDDKQEDILPNVESDDDIEKGK